MMLPASSVWRGFFALSLLLFLGFNSLWSQHRLSTEGASIVNEAGEPVLLRGMGLGGWMLQEGYIGADQNWEYLNRFIQPVSCLPKRSCIGAAERPGESYPVRVCLCCRTLFDWFTRSS